MKGKNPLKKLISGILCICMLLTGVPTANLNDTYAADTTTVYFYNAEGWSSVYAYVWLPDDFSTPMGSWPGTAMTSAPELGNNWFKITVSEASDFNVIIHDSYGTQYESYVDNSYGTIYTIPKSDVIYTSYSDVQAIYNLPDLAETTTVYFYNSENWTSVSAYVWLDDGSSEPMGSWPGTAMTSAPEIGDKWYKTTVPMTSAFHLIVNNSSSQYESYIPADYGTVYMTAQNEGLFSSAGEAEAAMIGSSGSGSGSGGGSGSNSDLEYEVDLSGIGANLPYITYEAEAASTNATVLNKSTAYLTDIQSEASGRQAVKLVNSGDFVEFTLTEAANAMVLRYSIPDSSDGAGINADLSLYVNGAESQNLALTSKYAWVYGAYPYTNIPSQGSPHRFFDESRTFFNNGTLPAGTKIRLQKDSSDTASYYVIDFIECELVDAAGTQPSNSLSVTDYGAVANDGNDDYTAFVNCISAAKNAGKEVWIPAGEFDLTSKIAFDVSDVTIRGAGMWYSKLSGAGVSFHYQSTCKFYDFAMTGVSTIRNDDGDLAGFEGYGTATNVTIENIWIEHVKVGLWSNNTTNLVVQGCRIRNTYADGINLCTGTNYATVRNNSLRNTGDDCIAIWPWKADSCYNTISNNTVQMPTLANGIAVYGGAGNTVTNNYIVDTINNGSGICIGSDYDTLVNYSGTTTVSNNVLVRCGSMHCDYNYPIGAIWIWSTKNPMSAEYIIKENTLYDCSYEGILFDVWNTAQTFTVSDTNIYGATDGIYIRGSVNGAATFNNVGVAEYTGSLIKNEDSSFSITETDKGVYATSMPEIEEETTTAPEETTSKEESTTIKVPEETTTETATVTETTTEEESTASDITNATISDGVTVNGYQISTTLGGLRTVYSIEPEINGRAVSERGLVYGLSGYATEKDMYVGSESDYIASYAATSDGISSISYGSATATSYVMTMTYDIGNCSAEALSADYYVRAYAKLSDGTYVYSNVYTYSVYSVADDLYQNKKMNIYDRHTYLYNNILSVVDPNYTEVAFDWNNSIVTP